jgi:UDP-GlcNAc:undecaprenyl-phosphate GlcNAc-1-phosphate transferase
VIEWLTISVVSVMLAVLAGWLLPAWAMERLMPALESSGKRVTNFRGRSVVVGLGIVWLVWAVGVAFAGLVLPSRGFQAVGLPTIALVMGALAFGMVDDVFGDPSARGFRGHLAALARGCLTTGALKLFGIGGLSLVAAFYSGAGPGGSWSGSGSVPVALELARWACAALVIALSANLVNLTDLRPGRALKSYVLLATVGIGIGAWATWAGVGALTLAEQVFEIGAFKVCLLALALGPVFAVWRYDLGERAMLGDAGANAAGAFAGFLLAWRSPLWLLAVIAAILLALNLASERVSFSDVIERVRFLRWLDGLGRLPADGPEAVEAPMTAPDGDARDSGDGE